MMNRIRAFFDRIFGRLLATFGLLLAATVFIWWVGARTLHGVTDQVASRLEQLQESVDAGAKLQGLAFQQLQAANLYLAGGLPEAVAEFERLGSEVDEAHRAYAGLAGLTPEERRQLARLEELHARLEVAYSLAHALRDVGRPAEAVRRVAAAHSEVAELTGLLRTLATGQAAKVAEASRALRASATRREYVLLAVLVATAGLVSVLLWRTLVSIDQPLRALVVAADRFGSGDLSVRVDGRMPGELRVLASAFTGMADRMRGVVGETVSTAEQIGASASDLSSVAEELAASSGEVSTAMVGITTGAEEQAAGLRTVQGALAEMERRAAEISESSVRVSELGERIAVLAGEKRREIGRAAAILLEVREAVRESSREVVELAASSDKIDAFVDTIQAIARQTNLLALNAAIEAARAGEHGRGFAVVAEEVRKLADGSARAAEEVAGAVRQIRKDLEDVVAAMEAGSAKVAGVEEVSKSAETALEEILAAVEEVRAASARVVQAAEENRRAVAVVEETVRAVGATAESHAASAQEVSAAAEEQSAATEEMSAASVELLQAAERLKELVSGFRV